MTKPCTRACCVSGIQFAVSRAQAGYSGAVTNPAQGVSGTMPAQCRSLPRAPASLPELSCGQSSRAAAHTQQRPARAHSISKPSTWDHQQRVAEYKRRVDAAHLRWRDTEVRIRTGPAIDMMVRSK